MVAGLTEAGAERHEIVAFAPTGLPRRHAIVDALAGLPVESKLVTLPAARAWRAAWSRSGHLSVERIVGPLDVFHFSDWMYPPQRGGVRATTIHDLVPLRFPELVHPRTVRMHGAKYRNAVASCDVIFVNSRFTARDVAEQLGFPAERIHVAYPGIDPRFRPEGRRADFGSPYLLAVSTLEPRKNLGTLIAAFEHVRARLGGLLLVVAGGLAPGANLPRVPEGVRLLGYVEDDELARLYRGAATFVYPSTFEGFGLPVVEALASGTPTVASAHPSLDEAAGTAALRADPHDREALAAAIETALGGDPGRRGAGFTHAARFTWRACGDAVLRGYQTAL
jgi:glycosyltransferase involved in cell wall biosynthesis